MSRLLIFGLGYVGTWIAKVLDGVSGCSRQKPDFEMQYYQFPHEMTFDIFERFDNVLITIPPDMDGDIVFRTFKDFWPIVSPLTWIGYLSSTSVYGDLQGGWAYEHTPCNPTSTEGKNRLKAEQQYISLVDDYGLDIEIFRLSAIYGPGRSPFQKIFSRTAKVIDKPDHCFSRIHVKDIMNILQRAWQIPEPGRILNLADDEPVTTVEYYNYACSLLQHESITPIPYEKADLSQIAKSFYVDNKKVSNEKLRKEFGYTLLYPNYRDGLEGLLND